MKKLEKLWVKIFSKKVKKNEQLDLTGLRTDLIKYKPIAKQLEAVHKCVLVNDEDYKNLSFDELDVTDYNLSGLSDDAKIRIIEIIKADYQNIADAKLAANERISSNGPIIFPINDTSKETYVTGNVIHNYKNK